MVPDPRHPRDSGPSAAERVQRRFGVPADTLVLLRPDAHVAAIVPFDPRADEDVAGRLYAEITGRVPSAGAWITTGETHHGQR